MGGQFGGLFVGQTGLLAQRKRMEIIGENIANVDTPGYHRRRVDLAPSDGVSIGIHSGVSRNGAGVSVEEITRVRNQLLATHAEQQAGVAEARDTARQVLTEIELAYGGLDSGGLRDQMTTLFNNFDDMAGAPNDLAVRGVVLQQIETVTHSVNRTVDQLGELFQRTLTNLNDQVEAVNEAAEEIAHLNGQLKVSAAVNADHNSLLDQRDSLVRDLALLGDIDVVHLDDGQVTVSLDGQLLVSRSSSSDLAIQIQADPGLSPLGYNRVSVVAPDGRELNIESGTMAANLLALSDVIPDARRDFDQVTTALVDGVNTLHQTGVGLDSSTGLDVFAWSAVSGRIEVSSDIDGAPERLGAAAVGGGALDNTIARELAAIAEEPSGPVTLLIDRVGSLAGRVVTATSATEAAQAASLQADAMAESESGVSLDEELTNLITAQRSYQAAARVITAVDEMLQVLMSIGVVGR